MTSIRSWEVKELKVASAGKTILEATKGEGDWTLLQPEKGKANYDSISEAVRAITDLEATGFCQDPSDFSKPEVVVELKSESKKTSFPIISKKDSDAAPKRYFAQRINPTEVLELNAEMVEKMLKNIEAVKPDKPAGTPQDATKEVQLKK